jgi:protein involved in polysaccharide export with SLBB domain
VRRAARLVALLGAVAVGLFFVSAAPKDVVLVYDLAGAPDATALEVELRRGDDLEFRVAGAGGQGRHAVRLPQGRYALSWRAAGPSGSRTGERVVDVEEEGTIVLPVGR